MGWVVAPRPGRFTPGKDPVPIVHNNNNNNNSQYRYIIRPCRRGEVQLRFGDVIFGFRIHPSVILRGVRWLRTSRDDPPCPIFKDLSLTTQDGINRFSRNVRNQLLT